MRVLDDQGITHFKSSEFATTNQVSDNEVMYTYAPTKDDQDDNSFGLSRDMLVEFDVNHSTGTEAGVVVVNDCYFAHFFSPSGISIIPVDIVFVIDTSGSMSGAKIMQARESLLEVISQLKNEDRFTIIGFSSTISAWKDSLVSVVEFRESARDFTQGLMADGGTNFAAGMEEGIRILKQDADQNYVQLLVMLTDGEPTAGVTDPAEIINIALDQLANTRISLNTIGFGSSLNLLLLEQLAFANRGIFQMIFEAVDAAKQLEGFYAEISNPILHSLSFSYPEEALDTITDVEFPLLFNGSEIVVAGKFKDNICSGADSDPFTVIVRGIGSIDEQTFESLVDPTDQTEVSGVRPSTERLVVYHLIQQLFRTLKITGQ